MSEIALLSDKERSLYSCKSSNSANHCNHVFDLWQKESEILEINIFYIANMGNIRRR